MALRQTSRLIGLAASAGALLLLQASPAMAVLVDGNPDARDPDRFEHITDDMNCVGASALKSVSYSVSGQPVVELLGKIKADAKVVATFELADECDDVKLGLATHNSVTKKVVTQQTGTFSPGTQYSLTVNTFPCDFQVNFFTGDVISQLTDNVNYSTPINNLIATGFGGTKECDIAPVAVTSTTSPTSTTSMTVVSHQRINTNPPVVVAAGIAEEPLVVESAAVVTEVEVAAVTLERKPEAQAAGLAETGAATTPLIVIGSALISAGLGLRRLVTWRKKSNRI